MEVALEAITTFMSINQIDKAKDFALKAINNWEEEKEKKKSLLLLRNG